MDCTRPHQLGSVNKGSTIQIVIDVDRRIDPMHMQGIRIRVSEDSDGLHSKAFSRRSNPNRNLAAIGYE
jgi:hypothetical protein